MLFSLGISCQKQCIQQIWLFRYSCSLRRSISMSGENTEDYSSIKPFPPQKSETSTGAKQWTPQSTPSTSYTSSTSGANTRSFSSFMSFPAQKNEKGTGAWQWTPQSTPNPSTSGANARSFSSFMPFSVQKNENSTDASQWTPQSTPNVSTFAANTRSFSSFKPFPPHMNENNNGAKQQNLRSTPNPSTSRACFSFKPYPLPQKTEKKTGAKQRALRHAQNQSPSHLISAFEMQHVQPDKKHSAHPKEVKNKDKIAKEPKIPKKSPPSRKRGTYHLLKKDLESRTVRMQTEYFVNLDKQGNEVAISDHYSPSPSQGHKKKVGQVYKEFCENHVAAYDEIELMDEFCNPCEGDRKEAEHALSHRRIEHLEKTDDFCGYEFTVASYNILAQNLLEDNYDLYSGTEPKYLEWPYRFRQLVDEILEHSPSVLCLQEVNSDHYGDFVRALGKHGYKGVYQKRGGDKKDGCATFYHTMEFDLTQFEPVIYYRDNVPSLDRDNIACIVKLKLKGCDSLPEICVANTHLLFNPRRGDVKLAQIAVLLAEIDRIAYSEIRTCRPWTPEYDPVIICGDFNSVPHSDIYKMMACKKLVFSGLLRRLMSGQHEGKRGPDIQMQANFLPDSLNITNQCQYLPIVKRRLEKFYDENLAEEFSEKQAMQTEASDMDHWMGKSYHAEGKRSQNKVLGRENISSMLKSDSVTKLPESCSSNENQSDNGQKKLKRKIGRLYECFNSWVPKQLLQSTGTFKTKIHFQSVYDHKKMDKQGYFVNEVTTCHGKTCSSVDYIFYSVTGKKTSFVDGEVQLRKINHGPLICNNRLSLLSYEEMNLAGPLPNKIVSSDHLLLLASFTLRDPALFQPRKKKHKQKNNDDEAFP